MKLVIKIEMDNAAFGDEGSQAGGEAARILREYASKIEELPAGDGLDHHLRDYNGNKVGGAAFVSDVPPDPLDDPEFRNADDVYRRA